MTEPKIRIAEIIGEDSFLIICRSEINAVYDRVFLMYWPENSRPNIQLLDNAKLDFLKRKWQSQQKVVIEIDKARDLRSYLRVLEEAINAISLIYNEEILNASLAGLKINNQTHEDGRKVLPMVISSSDLFLFQPGNPFSKELYKLRGTTLRYLCDLNNLKIPYDGGDILKRWVINIEEVSKLIFDVENTHDLLLGTDTEAISKKYAQGALNQGISVFYINLSSWNCELFSEELIARGFNNISLRSPISATNLMITKNFL